MEIHRSDGICLSADALAGGIIHVKAYGIDGPVESLLDRYCFIEQIPAEKGAEDGRTIRIDGGLTFRVDDDLGFSLARGDEVIFKTMDDNRPGTAATVYRNKGFRISTSISAGERFIGFGDQNRKGFLLNGQRESLWIRNQCSYIPVPFFMSSRGYGVFINTSRRIFFDFGSEKQDRCSFKVEKDYLDIYIMTGQSYADIIRSYARLTGMPQLPPLFTFGSWIVAQEHIRAHELLSLAYQLREAKIPCDILALEPGWMEKMYDESITKNWHPERFPYFPWGDKRPSTFINDLKLMGYHFGLWMLSNYDHTWEEERRIGGATIDVTNDDVPVIARADLELAEKDEHFGHQPMRMDTVTRPEEPYFEHLKKFVDQGVDYFKQDGYAQINLHPDRLHGNGRHDDEMHNIHYMIYTRQMIRGFEEHTKRRAFTLAVSGWAGFQRFPGIWTGDTGGGPQSLVGMLQDALMGQPIVTCDMNVDSIEGIHLGFLLPWAQINSWDYYRYPLYKGKFLLDVFRAYADLRMRLMPFFYSLARQAACTALPIMRPMLLVYPERAEAYQLTGQFELGDAFLVSAYTSVVTLPSGQWFDYWTGRIYTGDWKEQHIGFPKDRGGHLFVKEGAVIPLWPAQQYTGEAAVDTITWQLFPGTKASGTGALYSDDGISFEYRGGAYAEAELSFERTARGMKIFWGDVTGREAQRITKLANDLEILGVTCASVLIDGKDVSCTMNEAKDRVCISGVLFGSVIEIDFL
jgi:alpha-glucosidase